MFKGIFFDLDGTLLDTFELIYQSFRYVYKNFLNKEISKEDIYPHFGKPLIYSFGNLDPKTIDQLIAAYREFNLLHHDKMIKPFPEAIDTLKSLKQNNKKLAIITSKLKDTAIRGLKLFDLEQYFDLIIAMEDTEKHKPDPAPVKLALDFFKLSPNECLMVGDSPHDMLSAKGAGVKTVAVKWSVLPWEDLLKTKPDYIINSFNDLLKITEVD
ncbi:pyrophosphatase PpaX [Carboxydothermus pertinax]|uniref:Haloacid dehalogenase n=1 Tax=Carboxydothermus pertinax TaxID=870242 RepID=A0A1L8CXE9_9THEO|nr:pyrophosphatase PpaX [Carboxydothermus pertinax]GAV23605.1 haloacid dehalogenase [Carboxydothermus pertinax]